jgi:catecholate siderophore receptor
MRTFGIKKSASMLSPVTLFCGGLAASFVAVASIQAQAPAAAAFFFPRAADVAETDSLPAQNFDIPANLLADALADFSRQAGVRVSVQGGRLPEARVGPISGRLSPAEALAVLLEGTPLEARFSDARTVTILTEGRHGGAHALQPVVVRATRPGGGYGAQRSRTGTRTYTSLLNTPQSISIVSSEVIADQSMQSMSDVVRYVPGIAMGTGEGHRDQPMIRGNNTTADFFVDGVRDDAEFLRDLYNVQRVEALKGPNAMIFGRGGGGGVLNRVIKEAQWATTRELRVEGGAHAHRRATLDFGQGFGPSAALRLNAMGESSGGFRDFADLERHALNPTAAFAIGGRTTLQAGLEHLRDARTVDRGIPSHGGVPAPTAVQTFFGNPAINRSEATVNGANLTLEHGSFSGLSVRSRLQIADYDKYYANTVPGAVNDAGTAVALTAYSSDMARRNAISQTDVVYHTTTGRLRHALLLGSELGRQRTERVRQTGYFNDESASISVPFDAPTVTNSVSFRPAASDPDSRSVATTAALWLQDQISLLPHLEVVLGIRHDRFALQSTNRRTGEELARTDNLLSPRVGIVFKPRLNVSIYGSHSISHLPSAGDQFMMLTATLRDLEPERFINREVGIKWAPVTPLILSAAVYRLDRSNAAAPDPMDPTRLVQTGSQRSSGLELDIAGEVADGWKVVGGYASQRARITSATTAAQPGRIVPLVPKHSFSLWNRYDFNRRFAAGVGVVHQTGAFAGIDNAVRLPGFTRADGAFYVNLVRDVRLQVNVENLFDERYYPTAHSNNNIMPGAPRTLRVSLLTGF